MEICLTISSIVLVHQLSLPHLTIRFLLFPLIIVIYHLGSFKICLQLRNPRIPKTWETPNCAIRPPGLKVCTTYYSSPRLVVDRMEELIVELLLVENVWCQKQSWSFMNLLCSGMVGFGLRRNLGTTGKKHSSPPLTPQKVKKVLAMMTMISYKRTSRT